MRDHTVIRSGYSVRLCVGCRGVSRGGEGEGLGSDTESTPAQSDKHAGIPRPLGFVNGT